MLKALVVLLWPAGIAVILTVTALVAKRSVRRYPLTTASMNGHHGGDLVVGVRAVRSSIVGMLLIADFRAWRADRAHGAEHRQTDLLLDDS